MIATVRAPSPPRPVSRRAATLLATGGYVAVLHLVHEYVIAPEFSYLQYTYRSPQPGAYAVAIGLVLVLALVLPDRIDRPSGFVAWLFFLVAAAPSILVPQYTQVLAPDRALEVALWVAGAFLPVALLGTRRAVRGMLPRPRTGGRAVWTGIVVLAALLHGYVLARVGLRWQLPSLDDVYGVRDEFKTVDGSDVLLSYAVPAVAGVISPLFVARGLLTRRWGWLVVGVASQLFVFSFTGFRTAALAPVAMLVVFLIYRAWRRPPAVVLTAGTVVLSLLMWALDRLTGTVDYTSLLVRRFLVTPGLLTAAYVWFYDHVDKAGLTYSFLSPFGTYPYAQEPPLLVGAGFFHDAATNANASLFADGFANFGFPGMLLECTVLMVLLWLVDDACEGLDIRLTSLVFVLPTLALSNSGIFTTVLTHGLALAIVVCAVLPRDSWEGARR